MSWSRTISGSAVSKATYQGPKPKGEGAAKDAAPLELGMVKDWLVIGPFPVDDPAKDIEKSFLGDETAVRPDENGMVGTLSWKRLHVSMDTQSSHNTNGGICNEQNVDFTFIFGRLKNQVAYAHTYLFSPSGGQAQLAIHHADRTDASSKIWLNGQPTLLDPKAAYGVYQAKVTLEKGWNRLLVKVCCAESATQDPYKFWVSKWRFSAYFTALLPATYESKNISWMTMLPGYSASPPVIVGDRLYTTCGTSDLLCVSKKDGRILWLTTCTPCDAASTEEQAAPGYQDKVAPLSAELAKADLALVGALNAVNGLPGLPPDRQGKIDEQIKQKHELEKKLHDALKAVNAKKYLPLYNNEVSGTNGTPCTDGKRIYVVVGGGLFGQAAYVISAYTLDGQKVWSYHEALGCGEHGNHGSPALVDGKLIFGAKGTMLAFDAASGKLAWRSELAKEAPGYWDAVGYVTNPFVATRLAGTAVLIAIPSRIIRAADGQLISQQKDEQYFRSLQTPVIADGVLYADGEVEGRWKSFEAVQLPGAADGTPKVAWQLDVKDYRMEASSGFSIASGIVAHGLYFTVDTMGGFTAIDTGAKKVIYKRRLEMYQRADRGNFGFTASLTMAGKDLFAFDNTGCGLVLESGIQYKELGKNIIENLVPNWWQDYKQELFYASPVFDGAAMYLKGSEYLYCIREP